MFLITDRLSRLDDYSKEIELLRCLSSKFAVENKSRDPRVKEPLLIRECVAYNTEALTSRALTHRRYTAIRYYIDNLQFFRTTFRKSYNFIYAIFWRTNYLKKKKKSLDEENIFSNCVSFDSKGAISIWSERKELIRIIGKSDKSEESSR